MGFTQKTDTSAGLSLIELLVALAVTAMIAGAMATFTSACLDHHHHVLSQGRLHWEAAQIMDRMTDAIRRGTYVTVPNSHGRVRDLLAVSGSVNDDNDYYFGDPLFPRIDEDPRDDMNDDGKNGMKELDEDGDGFADEGPSGDHNDDEDELEHEDVLDGEDNDLDGNIDEDLDNDANKDGKAGIAGVDDDGDGVADEGSSDDDDEDGSSNEDGLNERVFWIPKGGGTTLREYSNMQDPGVVLSENVTFFQVQWVAPQAFYIELTLSDDSGSEVALREYVYARNVLQRTGKRVR